ncbi:uncharacterized protein LOC131623400 [Vicia villosa]|uniref:uncharacterized protein LOC131623400 n=1 Tax=Vicia villosa TaxID=3911 RepID=UPI00273BF3B5|nr:uncharacterized protein LOC131623400 [Vicia villosa]
MKWANGDVFEGCWSKGLRHGSGVYRFAKGDVCNGNFKSKFLHGKGKYTCSNGTIYKGYWDDGTMTKKIPDLENLVGDCMLLHICNKGESDAGLSCLVTKGKNIQGVMIVEKIEQYSETTKLEVMQGKKSSSIRTFFKTVKAKLERNLQLRIRRNCGTSGMVHPDNIARDDLEVPEEVNEDDKTKEVINDVKTIVVAVDV